MAATPNAYQLCVKEQSGALGLLTRSGALAEIEQAVLRHCASYAPSPPYLPQEIKNHLKPLGWTPEVRVPPFHVRYDDLRINDRYDLWKSFELDGARIGVAIEIERWEVWNDLLKFRRGIQRGQIAAGVILHDSLESLIYVFEHLRLVSEPLFSELPILFVAPAGEGLKNAANPRALHFAPYRMPDDR